jgi:PleD family two-component response regulator
MSTFPVNCFLIDDDKHDQETFCEALKMVHEHANCIFAINVEEAFKLLKDEMLIPDYIFIDMNMPRVNGNDCLVRIKKIKRLEHVPVYLYSIAANPAIIAKSKELGAAGFIIKPEKISELSDTLKFIFHDKKEHAGR